MNKQELNRFIDKISPTGPGGIEKIKRVLKTVLDKEGEEGITEEELLEALAAKQDILVSGTNLKTVNNTNLLGSGNIAIPKGDKGDKGDTGPQGPQGPQGLKGDTGVSADYPITIYNGLDSDATDQALAAAQGKVLDGEVSQLGQKLYESLPHETGPTITPNYSEGERSKNGNIGTAAQFGHYEPILLQAHCTIVLNNGNNVYWSNIAVVYECDSDGNFIRPILTDGNYQSKPAIYTNDSDTDIYVGISCYKTTLKYNIKTPVEPVDYFEAKGDAIKNYILSESFTVVSATYNSEGIVSSASVIWPDGTTGTISVARDSDGNATQVVATQGQDTYTLSITRNANGQVTATSIVKS